MADNFDNEVAEAQAITSQKRSRENAEYEEAISQQKAGPFTRGILREDGPSGAAAMRKKLGTAKPKTRLQSMDY